MKRNIEIDTLRGLACFFLVFSHVVGGMEFPKESAYYKFIDVFSYIRMPLFTFLSGIVYTYRPFDISQTSNYIKGKFNRLIIPMLIIGSIYAFIRYNIPGANHANINWQTIHIYPVAYFWFVEAIFLIFLLMIPIEYFSIFRSITKSIALFIFSIVIAPFFQHYEIFSINGFFYLLPFFLLGVLVTKFKCVDLLNIYTKVLITIVVSVVCVLHFNDLIDLGSPRSSYFSYIVGSISCFLLLSLKVKNNLLSKIGVFSYTIYLYHGFFTSGIRIITSKLGFTDVNIKMFICFSSGILIPILIHKIFIKYGYLGFLFLGLKQKTFRKKGCLPLKNDSTK